MKDNTKTIGRRKSSVARAYLFPGNGAISVNGFDYSNYFNNNSKLLRNIQLPLLLLNLENNYDISIKVKGGGFNGQSDAIKLALSRALFELGDSVSQDILRSSGLLKRDARCKERRKYGLKKARKASQFSKR